MARKTVFWGRDRSGCTFYRILQPGRGLMGRDPDKYITLEGHETSSKLDRVIEFADVFVIGRLYAQQVKDFIDLAHKDGRKVIYDLDDNPFEVSPYNNAYREMGVKEITIDLGDRSRPLWMDGLWGFDSHRNAKNQLRLIEIMKAVDGITTTTPKLAEFLGAFNKKVAVLPNAVVLEDWPQVKVPHHGNRICLQGGSSHAEDWFLIKPVLRKLWSDPDFAKDNYLVTAGAAFESSTAVVPPERLIRSPWVDIEAHSYRMATLGLDMALIPLVDNRFNQCKSAIKWIEMGALGVPSICSNIPPYSEEINDGVDGVLVRNDPDAWEKAIRRMAGNMGGRDSIGAEARNAVEQRFQQKDYLDAWEQAIDWIVEE